MATDAPPVPQHVAALERANMIRLGRAQIKRDVHAGRTTIRDVLKVHELAGVDTLEDVDPAVAGMTIGELLCTPYRWGVVRARKLLAEAAVPESKTLAELTSRRRRTIVALLEGHTAETLAEARRKRERLETMRNRERIAQRARDEREETARRRMLDETAREAREAAERVARGPVDVLDVDCPNCRSQAGDPCSWYDPVRDLWVEPKAPCADRLERAGLLS